MINIAICDDSEFIRKSNEELLVKYSIQRDLDCSIKKYEKGEDLLKDVDQFQLIFLDYQFEEKGANGMVIAKEIRKRNMDVAIIFLSSYTNIVFETFEVAAFRFLIKPLDEEKLYAAMDDFVSRLQWDHAITVKSARSSRFIKENQISYIEASGKNCIIYFINGQETVECTETLSAVEERLSPKLFFRCHKSYLINLKYVESFDHTDLTLQNEEVLPISRQRYKPFSNAYAEFLVRT
ncbi:MAG: LytTR family DNA-binding domain-containing protein [Lachnospiraceae bacterium]|nr:LytTR family DNA-binding domain-containing protein [Lachnospiraceae bacterium]